MSNTNLRLEYLASELAKRKVSKKDLRFCCDHLSNDHQNILKSLLLEHQIDLAKVKETKIKSHSLERKTITIFNEPQLAANLSKTYSRMYPDKRFAIIDLDRFNPSLDIFLKDSPVVKKVITQLDSLRSTGLNLLIDALHKKSLNQQYIDHIAIKVKSCKNLHYFSGSYVLDDYEYYKLEDLKLVIQFLKNNYDVVLLSVNNFIYDAFTCYALLSSSLNLFAVNGKLEQLNEIKRYTQFLEKKQNIQFKKNVYVGQFATQHLLNAQAINSILKGHYLGNIVLDQTKENGFISVFKNDRTLRKIINKITSYSKEYHEFNQNTSFTDERVEN